jgi:hypothetical protein
MEPNRQISLRGLMLLITGTAVAIGMGRVVVMSSDGFGHFIAPIIGAWCGAMYGAIRGRPVRFGLIGFAMGMVYLLFAPFPEFGR